MPRDFSAIGFSVLDVLGRHISEMPPAGGAIFVDQITMTVAGTAGATAVDCAILGLDGQIVTRVGRDDMGDFLVAKMERFGLSTELVQHDEKVQTSCSMLPIRPNGARSAFFVPGSAETFTLRDEDMPAALDARIVHVGGTGLLKAFDGAPTLELLKRARSIGRTTVFDLILATPETVRMVEPLLPYIDYFVPSIHEAAAMAGTDDPSEVAGWFRSRGVKNALLTLEGDGVFIADESGQTFQLPAHAIDVVDTTGCGDSFTAGVICGLSKGWGIRDCARLANAVAAQVAQGLGSVGALKSFEESVRFMETAPLRS